MAGLHEYLSYRDGETNRPVVTEPVPEEVIS